MKSFSWDELNSLRKIDNTIEESYAREIGNYLKEKYNFEDIDYDIDFSEYKTELIIHNNKEYPQLNNIFDYFDFDYDDINEYNDVVFVKLHDTYWWG